jgi:beta-glucosidase
MVLLKNNGAALPLNKGLKVALFGVASYKTIPGGTGSGEVNVAYTTSIEEGLSYADYLPDQALKLKYIPHIRQDTTAHPKKALSLGNSRMIPELGFTTDEIQNAAEQTDVAILTISRNAGEGADRKVEGNFNLLDSERAQLKAVANAFHAKGKKLVVILNIGGVIETSSWKDNADAILLAWQPGLEAGNAIADILSGSVNPSGKLAQTFPVKYEDVSSSKNFPGTPANRPEEVVYEEGIYVGYRYFNSFGIKPTYPFGYGLSYTKFAYSNLKLSSTTFQNKLSATITITNTGKTPGKEVVQLYLSAPKGTLDKPSEELKGFAKTGLLKPGGSQTLTFTLNAKDLASFNTNASAWIADAGNYKVKVGASSEDIKQARSFRLAKNKLVEKVSKALEPLVPINEMKSK